MRSAQRAGVRILARRTDTARPAHPSLPGRLPERAVAPRLPWADAGEEEGLRRARVHGRGPGAAARGAARRRLVDGGRRARAPALEPRQGVLARRGLHEGRPPRLLLQRRRADPAAPARPAAHDEADAGRHGRRLLLREDGPVAHAGLGRALPRRERRREDRRDRLPDGAGPVDAPVRREPRLHRDAPAALPVRVRRAARLPVLRPGPDGRELRGRARGLAPREGGARRPRPGRVPEDERRDRRPDLRAGAARLLVRPGPRLRRHGRTDDRARRSRPRDDGLADLQAHRQGVHRPQHEPHGREHLGRVLAAARGSRHRVDPAAVGRGRGGRRRRRTSGSTTSGSGTGASATCSRASARRRRT